MCAATIINEWRSAIHIFYFVIEQYQYFARGGSWLIEWSFIVALFVVIDTVTHVDNVQRAACADEREANCACGRASGVRVGDNVADSLPTAGVE